MHGGDGTHIDRVQARPVKRQIVVNADNNSQRPGQRSMASRQDRRHHQTTRKDQAKDHSTSALAAPQARRIASTQDEADTPLIYAASCAKCSDDGLRAVRLQPRSAVLFVPHPCTEAMPLIFSLRAFIGRHLDVHSRLNEVLFGLVMMLTVTLTPDLRWTKDRQGSGNFS